METIIGPHVYNEEYLTNLFVESKALDLPWNLKTMPLWMPVEKISNALPRIGARQAAKSAFKIEFNQFLGSSSRSHLCALSFDIFPTDFVTGAQHYSV
jgi:hypothetical protein